MRYALHPLALASLLGLLTLPSVTADETAPASIQPLAENEIPAVGTASPDRFFGLFRPFRTEVAALSPDGKNLAYTFREGDELYVLIVPVDSPRTLLAKVLVGTTETSTPMMTDLKEPTSPRVRWMGWANGNRLLIETNTEDPSLSGTGTLSQWSSASGMIIGVNADGSNGRTLLRPREVRNLIPRNVGGTVSATEISSWIVPTPDFDPEEFPTEPDKPETSVESDFSNDSDLPLDSRSPQSPTFFDYDPKDPDGIIVRTTDPHDYSLFHLNIEKGKVRYGPREIMNEEATPLLNRQGRVGASIANTVRTSFPHPFRIQKPTFFSAGRWDKLSQIAKIPATDFTLSPENYFGERSFPLGFDENPNVLYYASNVGRDTYGIYALDLKTGERTGKPIESPKIDLTEASRSGFPDQSPLVFDRYTRQLIGVRYESNIRTAIWLRPEHQEAQTLIESTLPGRSVDIVDWDQATNRFLALARGPVDPGSFVLLDRAARTVSEFVSRSPETERPEGRPITRPFAIDNPAGGELTGILTIPRAVREKPIPIVVVCADEPWLRTPTEFDSDTNALTQMGFAVLRLNPRGTWGFGTQHRKAAIGAFDEVQTADILTAIDQLSQRFPLNPKRVAIMGHQRGGYLALRAVQLHPDRFRCVVAIDPTVDLGSWIANSRWTTASSGPALTRTFFGETLLKKNPLMRSENAIKRPAFVLSYRGGHGAVALQTYLDARTFVRNTELAGTTVRFWTLSPEYAINLPEARSEVMRNIEDFLNQHVYAYNVQMGDPNVIEDSPTP